MKTASSTIKNVLSIIGMVLKIGSSSLLSLGGVILTAIGLFDWKDFGFYGQYISYKYFGGDAYTELQHAISDAASNISSVGYFLDNSFQFVCTAAGIVIAIVGCYLFASAISSYANSLTPAVKVEAPVAENTEDPEN